MLLFDNRHIYSAALDALGKLKRPVEALNVFHVMQVMLKSMNMLIFIETRVNQHDMQMWTTSLTFFFSSSNKCPHILT